MTIFKTIDGLFIGTRYGVWGIAVLGIVGSIILGFFNLALGIYSLLVFVAALLLSVGVTLLLLPKIFVKGNFLTGKRYIAGSVLTILSVIIIGTVYLQNGGFPELNLVFI